MTRCGVWGCSMADMETQSAPTVETRAEYEKNPADFVKHWLQAIESAGAGPVEKWEKDARETMERFRGDKQANKAFNILYSSIQTTVPALYNSEPIPDVRRRHGDRDEESKAVSQIMERALTVQCEMYDFDTCMQAAVKDRQLQGRGVTRARVGTGPNGSKSFGFEVVIWDDFRHGPAKRWVDVDWVAFRWKMTRDELVALDPKIGNDVQLDAVVGDAGKEGKDKSDLPDMFKRAVVWEVWDRLRREIYFIAESYSDGPVKVEEDPYRLRQFYPVPPPMYAVTTTDSLVPICEFTIWKTLADEIDTLTERIINIVKVMKWRGIYDGAFASAIGAMKGLSDGELAPAEDPQRTLGNGEEIAKRVWLMPIEQAVAVVAQLYEAREQAKASLYELTGVADILRGSTQASETATAQQIKAQWGSLRLQEAQRDVQRYARDLFRILADLMTDQLELPELLAMTGVQLPPDPPPQPGQQPQPPIAERIASILKNDLQREFSVEVETDSTIRADRTREQQNVGLLAQGIGSYMQAMLPGIQMGFVPPKVAIDLMMAMAQPFKMSRAVEMSMDEWANQAEQKAAQPPQPPPPDPKVEAEKAKAAAVAQKAQSDAQIDQQKAENERQALQMEMQAKQAESGLAMQKMQAEIQADRERHAMEMAKMRADFALSQQAHAQKREQMEMDAEAAEHGHGLKLEGMHAAAQAKQEALKARPRANS